MSQSSAAYPSMVPVTARTTSKSYIDALPSGSYVAIAHFYDPEESGPSELARKMVEPGLVLCDDWWPDGPRLTPLSDVRRCIVGGVGRKRWLSTPAPARSG